MNFFKELKRRNVVRVGIAYLIVAWLVLQVADLVLENINAPDWVMQAFMLAIAIGFPIVLVFAWAFELTPEGIKRESDVDRSISIAPQTGRKLDRAIIMVLALAVIFLLYQQFSKDETTSGPSSTVMQERTEPQEPTEVVTEDVGKSIAVLPFRDMSAAQDQGYFGEGIAEELLNALVKLEGIKVASRTSASSLADDDLDIPSIAERLGVNHILEGSVRTAGSQVRVTAQLIDVFEDIHLWSETYDGNLDDIFQIQDEITQKITAAMKLQFGDSSLAPAADALTANAEAYQLYLKGRHFWRQRSSPALQMAIELLEEATRLDPGFHRAWSNLAIAYENLPTYDRSFDEMEYAVLSKRAAQKALDINPDSSEALAAMADLAVAECRMVDAIRMYRQAVASEPNDPTAHHWYALTLLAGGWVEEASSEILIARELDPFISAVISVQSIIETVKGNYERSLALANEASALGMEGGVPYSQGQIHAVLGNTDVARDMMTRIGESDRKFPAELVETFLAAVNDSSRVDEFVNEAVSLGQLTKNGLFDIQELMGLAGAPGLSKLISQNEGSCPDLSPFLWGPTYREQRGTAEFFGVMEQLGLVDAWREFGWPDDCASLNQELADCPE